MRNLIWNLKQLLPLIYWSCYQEKDSNDKCHTYFTIYRMWLGNVYNAVTIEVGDYWTMGRMKQY